ncbi:MAG: malectin domain-containing carbohydrate-binding protein [Prolixibacteraceae bacterium]|nr:malectin domain-containing carbohydrate-binding protein [Prolixibacteraceae bacterium]
MKKIVLIIALAMASSFTFATTYYVSNNTSGGIQGSDSNNGTSTGTPFLTIQKALNMVTAGSTINVMKGTYSESLSLPITGTSSARITLRHYNSDIVTISAGNFRIISCGNHIGYWTIDGFNLYGNHVSGGWVGNPSIDQNIDLGSSAYVGLGKPSDLTPYVENDTNGNNGFIIQNCNIQGAILFQGHFNTVQNCYIDGMGTFMNGMNMYTILTHHITIYNNTFTRFTNRCIWAMNNVSYVSVTHNDFSHWGSSAAPAAIDFDGAKLPDMYCLIQHNTIHDGDGSNSMATQFENGMYNICDGNIIYNCTYGITSVNYYQGNGGNTGSFGYGYYNYESPNNPSNLVAVPSTANSGIGTTPYVTSNVFSNNVIYNTTSAGARIMMTWGEYFYNNTLYNTGNTGGFYFQNTTTPSGNVGCTLLSVANNIFSNIGGPSINLGTGGSMSSNTNNLFYSNISDPQLGSNYKTGNPYFTNTATYDFSILSSSPAINAGATIAAVTTDFLGTTRPQGAAYDIGAYEYIGSTPTLTVAPSRLAFGNVVVNTTSAEQTYLLTGSYLTADVTVTAPTGYEVSKTTGTGFAASVSVTQTSGNVNQTIYVRFKPTAVQQYNGNITNASAGATTQNVALTGTGAVLTTLRLDGGLASGTSTFEGKTFVPLLPYLTNGQAYNSIEGQTLNIPIANTLNDALYQKETWIDIIAPSATFTFPNIVNGNYTVHLHFVDWSTNTHNPGDRVFAVALQGSTVIPNLDIISEVGKNAALLKSFDVTVSNSQITLTITKNIFYPEIAAVEILPQGVAPVVVQPAAPTVGTITQPSCVLATGSVVLNGLPATGTWTLTRTPGGTTTTGTRTSTTISGLAAGTYTYTVTNAAGSTSAASANVVINAQPASPSAPTVGTITQPTYDVATGSVVLNGLPATGTWTLTRTPGGTTTTGTGTSTTISGLAAGTYTYTVTNAAGCISAASANVVINAQPVALRLDGGLASGTSTFEGKTFVPLLPYLTSGQAGNSTEGQTLNIPIWNTLNDALYQKETYITSPSATFTFPNIVNGNYTVHLHFVDWATNTYHTGDRVFAVALQGSTVIPSLDIISEVGKNAALLKSFNVTVSNGQITLTITKNIFYPEIAAIEILPQGVAPLVVTQPVTLRLDGGLASGTTTFEGKTFSPLLPYLTSGQAYNSVEGQTLNIPIANTLNDVLYQTETYIDIIAPSATFTFPIANGIYSVYLHFVDWATNTHNPGDRVFAVALQGSTVIPSLDIISEVGKNAALLKDFDLTVSTSQITLTITKNIFYPEIAAVEILPQGELPLVVNGWLKSAQIPTTKISPLKQPSTVIVYPNPFGDILRVMNTENITRIELVNMSAKRCS